MRARFKLSAKRSIAGLSASVASCASCTVSIHCATVYNRATVHAMHRPRWPPCVPQQDSIGLHNEGGRKGGGCLVYLFKKFACCDTSAAIFFTVNVTLRLVLRHC
jgi:hypothetical protein